VPLCPINLLCTPADAKWAQQQVQQGKVCHIKTAQPGAGIVAGKPPSAWQALTPPNPAQPGRLLKPCHHQQNFRHRPPPKSCWRHSVWHTMHADGPTVWQDLKPAGKPSLTGLHLEAGSCQCPSALLQGLLVTSSALKQQPVARCNPKLGLERSQPTRRLLRRLHCSAAWEVTYGIVP